MPNSESSPRGSGPITPLPSAGGGGAAKNEDPTPIRNPPKDPTKPK